MQTKGFHMNLIFKKDILVNALTIVLKAIPSKTTSPIMECILFDADTKNIRLIANDEELGIETLVDGSIIEKGKIAIDAKLIYDIVRKIGESDDDIHIQADAHNNVVISSNESVFHISGRDGDEFNALPYIEKDSYISISQFTLKEVIRQTIFSVSNNDSNKMMTGELIEVNEDNLKFVTLDGHRISIRNIKMKDSYPNVKAIVPSKTLNDISRIIGADNEKEVLIYFSKNHILFEFDETKVVSRLIDGEYFKIEHMISSDYETKISLKKSRFLNAIEQATILIRENEHKPIILDIKDGSLELKVKSSFGTMDASLDIDKTGKDLMIAFNPKFLIDALKVIDDEVIDIYMTNAKSPCFIRNQSNAYIYLILPVNFIA